MSRKWDLPPACLPLTFHLWCEGWTALLSAPSRPKPDCGWQGHRVRIQGRRALVFLGPLLWLSHLLLSDCLVAPLSSSAFRRRRFSPAHSTRPQNARSARERDLELKIVLWGVLFCVSDMTNRSLLEMVVRPKQSCSTEQASVTGGHESELHPFSFS